MCVFFLLREPFQVRPFGREFRNHLNNTVVIGFWFHVLISDVACQEEMEEKKGLGFNNPDLLPGYFSAILTGGRASTC